MRLSYSSKLLTISIVLRNVIKLYMTLRFEYRGRIFRDRREIHLPKVKSTIGQFTFKFTGAKDQLRADGLTLGSLKGKTFKYLQE